jgi:uncharacterized protein (TIGR03086 family)
MGSDLQELYRRACVRYGEHVHAITDDQWTGSTPCTEWDVRTLVGHLITEVAWVPPLMGGRSVAEVGDELSGDLTGEDPAASWDRYAPASIQSVGEAGALERTVRLTKRELPASEYVSEVFVDLLVHGWDLARAIGADEILDPESVEIVYERMKPHEAELNSSGVFGSHVEAPEGADLQTRLLAVFGRTA